MSNWPKLIVPFLPASGMAIFPFILLKNASLKSSKKLLYHEHIHLQQQIELLVIPFYVCYLFEYSVHRFSGKTHHQAYRSISFEREAYHGENIIGFLKKRPLWNFRNYFKN